MFSIFDAWLLQSLHFPNPERLTIILKSEAVLLAALIPAGAAAKVDPMVALRQE
jgi:hypothetical protein